MLKDHHLLIICTVWPEPLSSAAGSRMMQLIGLFLDQSCKVTLACDAQETAYSDSLKDPAIHKIRIELNNSSFDDQIKTLAPTIVLFDRFMTEEKYGWRVAGQCPEALRILDTEDLHCLRKARQTVLKKGLDFEKVLIQSDITKREIASIYRSDLSLIISTFEMNLLTSFFKVDQNILHYIPLLADPLTSEQIASWPEYEERKGFVSIGNFLHDPNTDAVVYMKETVWPLIREQLPDAELHIYGAYMTEKVKALHNEKQGFLVKGRAENSGNVIREARVMLAPLRFGAGIKGKLLEAMLNGTPSVTSSVGAEGMRDGATWNGYVADSPAELASAAVKLYSSPSSWKNAQEHGLTLVREFYNKAQHSGTFIERLHHILHDMLSHRASNFTGAMLLHHYMSSTKYMSRWIELKNKPLS